MTKLRVFSDIFKLIIKGLPKPIGVSIDITNKCNLRCKHCYFWRENYKTELDDMAWLNKIKEIKKQYRSILQASWCGGEPLLRKGLVEKGMRFFHYNMVITNGTLPLPEWKDCVFKVSIDGTRKFHEMIRGKGTYDKIKQNIINGIDLKIDIACIINRLNYRCIEDMIVEWSKTNVNGIHFGFYSPNRSNNNDLWLDFETRDNIIKELKSLKKEYGNFINAPDEVLDLMLSKNCNKVTSRCPFKDFIICLSPDGKRKSCPAGDQAICSKCGHSPPFFMKAIDNRDTETLNFLFHQII